VTERRTQLVQLLLPLYGRDGAPFPRAQYDAVRHELTNRCGGLTAYTRAPAEGFWQPEPGEGTARDDVVVFEVLDEAFDAAWWSAYRAALERRFAQDALVVRAYEVRLL
jgi:hypothetical protein